MLAQKQSQRTLEQDHMQGKAAENDCLQALQTLTQHRLVHHTDRYAPWDYESVTTVIELKDRNCFYDTYEDTMINGLKVDRARNQIKRVFFAFKYIDGLYYIKYNKDLFEKYKTKSFKLDDRKDYKESDHIRYYIPKEDLKCLVRFAVKPLFLED